MIGSNPTWVNSFIQSSVCVELDITVLVSMPYLLGFGSHNKLNKV